MKMWVLLLCYIILNCSPIQLLEENLRPKELFFVQKNLFDSISVEKIYLNTFEKIEIEHLSIIIKEEQFKKILEESILESSITKKIEK